MIGCQVGEWAGWAAGDHQFPSSSGLGASSGSSSSKYLSSSSRATMSRLSKSGLSSTVLQGEGLSGAHSAGDPSLPIFLLLTLWRRWGLSPDLPGRPKAAHWQLREGANFRRGSWSQGLKQKAPFPKLEMLHKNFTKLEDVVTQGPVFLRQGFSTSKILPPRGHLLMTGNSLAATTGGTRDMSLNTLLQKTVPCTENYPTLRQWVTPNCEGPHSTPRPPTAPTTLTQCTSSI